MARILRRIDAAVADGRLVRVGRHRGWDRLNGSLVERSAKWLLLALEVDAGFDGHVLVRVSDVRRVEASPSASFVSRALGLEGHWPLPRLEGVDLSSTRRALRTLDATRSLVAVHDERDRPDELLIGVPHTFGRKTFRLRNIGPDAEWEHGDSVHRYRSVSRIDVGTAYARRLLAVGGPPPTRAG